MICEDFARRGIKTAAGVVLQPKSVYIILRNIKYTGLYVYGEIRIPNFHERLITDELFQEAQERLELNAKGKSKRKRKDAVDYLLSGKAYCGKCKNKMVGECGTGKHGGVYHYYKCSGRKNKNSGCDMEIFRKEDLESAIIRITQQDVLTDDMIDYLVERVLNIQADEAEDPVLKGMEKTLKDTQKKIRNIMSAIEAGILTPTTKDRLTELEAEKDRISAEITKTKVKKTSYTADEIRFYLESFRDGNADNPDFSKQLIEVFVKAIYIYDDYLVMFYNFFDGGGGDGERHSFEELADEAVTARISEGTCSDSVPSCP